MRNLKKVLAVILTVAMLASFMVPAFAAVSHLDEAKKLQTIGLFAGGEADLKLDEDVTRIQGLTFAIRAAGKEAEALAMTDEEVAAELAKFNDAADIPSWNGNGPKYVAYAIKNGITVGDGQGNFKPLDKISGRAFLVFLLKTGMGYKDVTTLTAPDVAVDAGVLTPSQAMAYAAAESGIIRDDAAAILFGAAMYGVNADGKAFIDALIESGFVKAADAIAAGFKEDPKAGALAVEDVEVLNLVQVKVTFNKDVTGNEEVEDKGNYWFENDKGKDFETESGDKLEVIDVKVDGNVALLTLGNGSTILNVENQSDVVFFIDEEVTGKELEFDLEFDDFEVPSIVDAEVIGINSIKVTFSEPINAAAAGRGNFEVKNDTGKVTYRVTDLAWAKANTEVVVKVGKDLKDGDEIVLKVDGKLEDYAGYRASAKTFELTVEEDDRDIEVVGYRKATEEGVILILNKDVTLADGTYIDVETNNGDGDLEDFYHTNSKNRAWKVEIDGNEIELFFTEDQELPTGTAYVYINSEALVDLWGNENATLRTMITVEADTEAPEVEEITVAADKRTIDIEFDQILDEDSAEDEDNYTILTSEQKEAKVQVRSASLQADNKTVRLRLNGELAAGVYYIEIDGVEDKNGNATDALVEKFEVESAPIDLRLDGNGGDLEIDIYADNATWDQQYGGGTSSDGEYTEYTIIVDFGRQMETGEGRYAVDNLDNYAVKFNGDSKLYTLTQLDEENNYKVDLSVDSDSEVVEITIEVDNDERDHKLELFVISRVADVTGALSAQSSQSYVVKATTSDPAEIAVQVKGTGTFSVDEVKAIDKETIEVTFTADIDDLDADDFVVFGHTSSTSTIPGSYTDIIGSIKMGSDDDTIVITLDEELKDNGLYGSFTYLYLGVKDTGTNTSDNKAETETRFGNKLATGVYQVDDAIAPSFDEDLENTASGIADGYKVTTGSTLVITLYFTEDLDETAVDTAVASTFKLKADDDKLTFVSGGSSASLSTHEYSLDIDDNMLNIYVLAADATEDVEITFTSNNAFTDLAGNSVKDFSVVVFTD